MNEGMLYELTIVSGIIMNWFELLFWEVRIVFGIGIQTENRDWILNKIFLDEEREKELTGTS